MFMRRTKSAEFSSSCILYRNLQDENDFSTKSNLKLSYKGMDKRTQYRKAREVYKNLLDIHRITKIIDACKQLSTCTQNSLGPHGSNYLVYKLFLNELVYKHPSPKALVLAAKEQHKEFGDGANLVLSIAGQHLEGAKNLIKMGLNLCEIIHGYKKASNQLGEILEDLVEKGSQTMDVRNKEEVILRLKDPICSKVLYNYEMGDILCSLIAEACIQVCPENLVNFNVDDVRVARLLGVNPCASKTFRGMVLNVDTLVGSIKTIENAKVLVVAGGVDTARVYTLENYAKTEEAKAILESGAKVIVSGAGVGWRAHRFCNVNEIMVLKITSQNELHCFCRTTHAVALSDLNRCVDSSYLGKVDSISVDGDRVTVTKEQGCVTTVLLGLERADNIYYEQLERAVVNGVKIYKALCKDSRIVPGAGATEIEIAKRLKEFSLEQNGSSSHAIAIAKYAESFELIPKTLAKNSNLDVEDIMKNLKADHEAGKVKVGIDVKEGDCKDASIWDLYTTKYQALQYAADAVCDALSLVDQDPEPESMFDRLMAKHKVSGESAWQQELPSDKLISIFYQSIWTNNLQPKGEVEMLAVKIHRDKLFGLSPDGTLSSFDIPLSYVCWSIPVDRALGLYFPFKSSQSECSYFVDSSRVFMHTKETKPVDLRHHQFEFFDELMKYPDEEVAPSRLVTEIYVDPVKGHCISPERSKCEEILCIRAIHGQLVGYKPGTKDVLWYERVATFYIWMVSRDEGLKLQKQQEVHRSRLRALWAAFRSQYVRLEEKN